MESILSNIDNKFSKDKDGWDIVNDKRLKVNEMNRRILGVVLLLVLEGLSSDLLADPVAGTAWIEPKTGMEFVWVPTGCFNMGGDKQILDQPLHKVCVKGFWMGRTEVTQGQYKQVMGNNPSYFRGSHKPVDTVGWNDASNFTEKMNKRTGTKVRLWSLRKSMQEQESILAPWLVGVDPSYRASSRNFAHYLALRHADRRPLQESLDRIGVSTLGRAESNVLANLDKVLGILLQLAGEPWQSHCKDEPASIQSSRELLEQHTTILLGPPPPGREVRIMVTLPSEAASNFGLVRHLANSGMDIARINCAHDSATEWQAMAANVRRAAEAAGRPVRILMDLGGPKLRTGQVAAGPAVLKLHPQRDVFGRVSAPQD
jgi:hypothetical protein